MVFFLKSHWEAQGQSPAPCPWGATAILLCFLEEHTDAAQSEAWKKTGFGVGLQPYILESEGERENFQWFYATLWAPESPSGSPGWGSRHPEAEKQASSVQARTMPLQIQRLLSFFQGLLTVRWKGSWRYLEGLPALWESRSWQLHLCKSILRATIAQKSPVSGDWGPTKLLGSHPPSQGLQVLDLAGAAGSGLFRYTTHNPKSREASRMCKDMQTVSCLAYIIQSARM